jgi:hypothetical protein
MEVYTMNNCITDEEVDMLELSFSLLCDIVDAFEYDKPLFEQARLGKQQTVRKIAKAQKYLCSTYRGKI